MWMWIVLGTSVVLAAAGWVLLLRARGNARRLRGEIEELQSRLAGEERRRRECEDAIDRYYIPQWLDAVARLGTSTVCTCPPERYRATCLLHAPAVARWQRTELLEIERRSVTTG